VIREGLSVNPGNQAPAIGSRASLFAGDQHPYSLGRAYRLGSNRQYQWVYRRGKPHHGQFMVLIYLRGKDLKAGFSVSSKVGNSVTRNRLRRYMKEDFRLSKPDLNNGRYVFVARPKAADQAHRALSADMRELIRKAGLFKPGLRH
jgi:ribonuclease P protein component